jgi:hypothetical protein
VYLAKVDRLLIRKEAVIVGAKLAIDFIVRGLGDLYLWLSHQVGDRAYLKDLKMYFQSLGNSPDSLER